MGKLVRVVQKRAKLGKLYNTPEAYIVFIVLSVLLLQAKLANALSLSEYYKDAVSSSCPVETWNIIYKTCRAPACGTEQYDHRQDNRTSSGNGGCPPFWTNSECAPLLQPGEVMASCITSCTFKSKLSRLAYWDATHTGAFYRIRDKLCSTSACGEESKKPSTYTSCRNLDNDIDDSRIIAAMNSGKGIDRAAALLAKVIKETQNLPIAVRNEIATLLNDITLDSSTAEEKIDSLRRLLLKNGSATTVDQVRETWAKAQIAAHFLQKPTPSHLAEAKSIAISGLVVDPSITFRKLDRTLLENLVKPDGDKAAGAVTLAIGAVGAGGPVASAVGAGASSATSWDYSGYTIGYGINSITGEAKGKCLMEPSSPPSMAQEPSSKIVRYSLDKIDDYQSLLRSLFASTSFSVAAGFGKANAGAQFSQSFKSLEHSIYLLAKVDVSLEDSNYDFPELIPAWAKIQNSGEAGRKRFFDGCGDRYVRGMREGSNFVALYQLLARDEIEKQNIQASLSGGSATGTFTGSAEFVSALDRVHRFTSIQVRILSLGYPGGTIPDSGSSIIRYSLEFPDKINSGNAYPITATTGSYSDFPSFQTGEGLIDNRQRAYLSQADLDFQWLLSQRSVINYAKSDPKLFDWGGRSKSDLLKSEREIIKLSDALAEHASACLENAKKCSNYEPIDRSTIWLPSTLPKKIQVGGCSGNLDRFGTYNGGCLDTSTSLTWSAPSTTYWNFDEAVAYCSQLTENQTRGWILPSIFEVASLKSPGGGAEGLKEGASLNDWFWAHDGGNPKRGQRVNIDRGTRKEGEAHSLKFRVMCRQGL